MATPQGFVGMYDFKDTLGKGHFSVVKLAQHVITKDKVAVKIIEKTKLTPLENSQIHHEIRVMKLLRHPHVVRLYQVVDTTQRLYLILELGCGGDLYEYITKMGKIPEEKAKVFFGQIVQGVAYCHRHHVAHRDLKPENVVFCKGHDDAEVVKVTDFGLSNNFSPGEMMKTMCGSLLYSAPEILLQDPYDGTCVDVWSLGIILYMMVVGKLPFREHNDNATLIKILEVRYAVPDHVSASCKDLIAKMIVREPSERAKIEQIAQHPWLAGTVDTHEGDGEDVYVPGLHDTKLKLTFPGAKSFTPEDHEAVLLKLENSGTPREHVLTALAEGSYDYEASTYFLLAEQRLRSRKAHFVKSVPQSPASTAGSSPHDLSPHESPRLRRHVTLHGSPNAQRSNKGSLARPNMAPLSSSRPVSYPNNEPSEIVETPTITPTISTIAEDPVSDTQSATSSSHKTSTSDPENAEPLKEQAGEEDLGSPNTLAAFKKIHLNKIEDAVGEEEEEFDDDPRAKRLTRTSLDLNRSSSSHSVLSSSSSPRFSGSNPVPHPSSLSSPLQHATSGPPRASSPHRNLPHTPSTPSLDVPRTKSPHLSTTTSRTGSTSSVNSTTTSDSSNTNPNSVSPRRSKDRPRPVSAITLSPRHSLDDIEHLALSPRIIPPCRDHSWDEDTFHSTPGSFPRTPDVTSMKKKRMLPHVPSTDSIKKTPSTFSFKVDDDELVTSI